MIENKGTHLPGVAISPGVPRKGMRLPFQFWELK